MHFMPADEDCDILIWHKTVISNSIMFLKNFDLSCHHIYHKAYDGSPY